MSQSSTADTGFVYVVTHGASGKRYAGFTANSVRTRWNQHVATAQQGNPRHLSRAIRKHGPDAFIVQEVYRGPKEIALEIERGLIEAQGLRDPKRGYNHTTGGEHWQHSEETKARIRAKRALQAPPSAETKAKLAEASRRAARNRPPEVEAERRRKMSEALTGRPDWLTPEGRARQIEAKRGQKHTPEARAKMSAARIGRRHSAETRAKQSANARAALAKRSPEQKAEQYGRMARAKNSPPDCIVRDAVRRVANGESQSQVADSIKASGYSCCQTTVGRWSRGLNRAAAKEAYSELQA